MRRSIAVVIGVLTAAALSGCGGNNNPDGGMGGGSGGGAAGAGGGEAGGAGGGSAGGATGGGAGGGMTGPVLPAPDRSTSIALTSDDAILVAVNPDNNTVSIFNTSSRTRSALVNTGANTQPVSVSIHPDNTTAFVLLRQSQQLIKITGINTINPAVDATRAAVGSEPTGVALTPSGATAVVANFGEDRVSFVDTATMAVTFATVGPNPRAVAITNNGDMNDADETAYVTLFYGAPTAEASDTGRTGKVVPIPMGTRTPGAAINLAPIADTGFAATMGGTNVGCSPNQLFGIAIDSGKVYVSHVCAAPQGPVTPFTNVFAAVSVIDIPANTENTSNVGSVALSRLIAAQDMSNTGNLLGVPIALDFKAPGIAYVVSQAGDTVQRLEYNAAAVPPIPPIRAGVTAAFAQIALGTNGAAGGNATKVPIGIVAGHTSAAVLYTNNWTDRSVSIINLSNQAVDTVMRSEALPAANTPEDHVLKGKRFYFTGQGRWSNRGVNSCGSCHPDGLSDNLTWIFAAGPRQTTPMDGTFAKSGGQEQRALNWTAIFDEVHDFELNTRGTAGGIGALVSAVALAASSRLDLAVAQSPDGGVVPPGNFTRNDNLSGSTRNLMFAKSVLTDWEEINDFSKTIRANKKPTNLGDVTAGLALFQAGKCMNCHGGPKWTVSRVPYAPSPEKNGTAAATTAAGVPVAANGLRTQALTNTATGLPVPNNTNVDTLKVAAERLPDAGIVGPERITCVLRRVGTFSAADAIEKKANGDPAQGENGFNPPSLLGLATSAPYFHAGKSPTLNDLLTNPSYTAHLRAGDANFTLTATQAGQLAAFLNSIDDSTPPIAPEANTDTCAGY